jgi:large subunit ribosomal protein L15
METMNLSNLKPRPGSKHRKKRLGCGESSGHGKTSGKGHKGQKARSGGSIRLGFEGGQMPLIRRIPKRGFNNTLFKKVWGTVNIGELEVYPAGTTIDEEFLRKEGFVRGKIDGIKILGEGELTKKLVIVAKGVSAGAKEKIEKAGGTVTLK